MARRRLSTTLAGRPSDGPPTGACRPEIAASAAGGYDPPVASPPPSNDTVASIAATLSEGRGCVVYGEPASGKADATAQAVNGAVWINLGRGPLAQAHLMVDLAEQLGGGSGILEHYAAGLVTRAFDAADTALGGQNLVIDGVDQLWSAESSTADVLSGAATDEMRAWLSRRLGQTPTVLISDKRPHRSLGDIERLHHEPPVAASRPPGLPESLWELVKPSAGAVHVAQTLAQVCATSRLESLAEDLDTEPTVEARLRILALELTRALGVDRRPGLAALSALPDIPDDELTALLGEDAADLDHLRALGLLVARRGRTQLWRPIRESISLDTREPAVCEALRRGADRVLRRVNDIHSLVPADAGRVLRAHDLLVHAGDFRAAARLARLSLSGLIDLARRLGRHDFGAAFRLYDDMYQLRGLAVEREQRSSREDSVRRIWSYVTHYRAYYGGRSDALAADEVRAGYEEAIAGWPENALWHQRLIQACIRGGDEDAARDALERADAQVPDTDHPEQPNLLQLRPAGTALRHSMINLGLELIDETWNDQRPGVQAERRRVLRRLDDLTVETLGPPGERLVLLRPTRLIVQPLGQRWMAALQGLTDFDGVGATPGAAVAALVERLRTRTKALLASRVSWLSDMELAQKTALISTLDLLNSDLGIAFDDHRWVVARVQRGRLCPLDTELGELPIADGLQRTTSVDDLLDGWSPPGLFAARIPVHRDGQPTGAAADRLEPLGEARDLSDLLHALREVAARHAG